MPYNSMINTPTSGRSGCMRPVWPGLKRATRKYGEKVQLPGWNEPKADILGMVSRWLSNETSGRWVMVVDNVDDARVILDLWNGVRPRVRLLWNNKPVIVRLPSTIEERVYLGYLSQSRGGIPIDRTQSRHCRRGPMDDEVALALLQKKLDTQDRNVPHDDLVRLVR